MDLSKLIGFLQSGDEQRQVIALQELSKIPIKQLPEEILPIVAGLATHQATEIQFWARRLVKQAEDIKSPVPTSKVEESSTPQSDASVLCGEEDLKGGNGAIPQNGQEGESKAFEGEPAQHAPGFKTGKRENRTSNSSDKTNPRSEQTELASSESQTAILVESGSYEESSEPPSNAQASEAVVEGESSSLIEAETSFESLASPEVASSAVAAISVIKKLLQRRNQDDLPRFLEYLSTSTDPLIVAYLVKHVPATFPNDSLLLTVGPYLRHADDRVVANTVEGLGCIKSPKSLVLLSQILAHKSHRVRANAGRVLRDFDPKLSKAVLQKMFAMRDKPQFLIAACHATKMLRDPDYLQTLVSLAADPLVGDSALDAITGIGGQEALSALESLLEIDVPGLEGKIKAKIQDVKLAMGIEGVGKAIEGTVAAGAKALDTVVGWFTNTVAKSHKTEESIADKESDSQDPSKEVVRKPKRETLEETRASCSQEGNSNSFGQINSRKANKSSSPEIIRASIPSNERTLVEKTQPKAHQSLLNSAETYLISLV